jgi:hypothetical protein
MINRQGRQDRQESQEDGKRVTNAKNGLTIYNVNYAINITMFYPVVLGVLGG